MAGRSRAADYKGPGGKLVRVRLTEENGTIKSVRISGDFFLVPEDSLPQLERILEGSKLEASEVCDRVKRFFETSQVQGLGVSTDDVVHALLSAKEETVTA